MGETPSKYVADDRLYDDKSWLYEKYWGELLSAREIAEECDGGHAVISKRLRQFGIPRRTRGYERDNAISPFTGFYLNTAARTDERSRQQYEKDHEPDTKDVDLNWQKAAKRTDRITDKAILEQ